MNILVSACLLGIFSRYDGSCTCNKDLVNMIEKFNLIPICPEQLGGLATPREPSERLMDKVFTKSGKEVTNEYQRGAEETLKIAKLYNCKYAVLKERSPSCGSGIIYDGTFTGKRISGNGVTSELLIKNGIIVVDENRIEELLTNIK